ncbi:hypothetical protein FDI40_gp154 [Agrobacterium phage Atu_ph07]|uniref:Uncharacterized protein n=1 Tax=Agrobacterium phage Atu_ph07 TaxID=2024264 RepID=A0A2L0UZH7_9CAUD|nr:hypothetical protein FDI40_gp154 [Agrobacterium phage Atu_ph07]AUZ94936.1 hypothetical protein [Agrobacterium phage Atu_ph07]
MKIRFLMSTGSTPVGDTKLERYLVSITPVSVPKKPPPL